MAKYLIAMVLVLAMAVPGWAAISWDGTPTGNVIAISLNIAGWAQVNLEDADITFSGTVNGDWDATALCGVAYGQTYTKTAMDPWAGWESGGRYFESSDGGRIHVVSNADIYCTIDPSDNLKTAGGDEIPTWFTLAATGDTGTGFLMDGSYKSDGTIPGDADGCYASDNSRGTACDTSVEDGYMELCDGSNFYPGQYCFTMADDHAVGSWSLDLPGSSQGTLKWLARIHRNGITDAAGSYSADINVDFYEGSAP